MRTTWWLNVSFGIVISMAGCGGDDDAPIDAGGGVDAGPGIDAGRDAGTDDDAGTGDDAGSDAGMEMDAEMPVDGGPCPDGYAGPTCEDCATGFQDEDDDGTCLADCSDALYCGAEGTCSIVDGARFCTCNEGFDGPECNLCAEGYRVDGGCILDEPEFSDDLVLWLDASLSNSASRGADNLVNSWRDQRGTGPGLFVATGGQRPLYVADGINGRPAIRFDGFDDNLLDATFTGLSGPDYTVFVVIDPESTGSGVLEARPGANPGILLSRPLGNTTYRFVHRSPAGVTGGETVTTSGALPASRPVVLALRRVTSGALDVQQIFAYDDGMPRAAEASIAATAPAFGGSMSLRLGHAEAGRLNGLLAELLVYDRQLTNVELDRVQRYLAAKYRLTP